jgi:asparagine synthase (glutamine-hydrolysing)
MCGLAGIIASESNGWAASSGQAMLDRLYHRGPDDHGWLAYSPGEGPLLGQGVVAQRPAEVLLLHRRLSILDLSEAGRQPMASADRRYWIVYNGEIYNYLELREELARLGAEFRTGTDTEVLLAALIRWGTAALPRLIGMFAFALLDTVGRTLMLARDFFGIKPLYYCTTSSGFGFASEIKALLEIRGLKRRINPQVLYTYLRYGVTDHQAETFLEDIQQLLPAHFLVLPLDAPSSAQPQPYWRLDLKDPTDLPFDQAARRLREMFLDSVRLHLRSDVPVGTALSGGIDSSAIVTAVRKVGQAVDFHSFSFLADDPVLDEERWVDTVASVADTTVHKVRITPGELAADFDRLIAAQDEPFQSTSVYAQYRVFQLAREAGVKVLLDGQGADEMIAGYVMYLASRLSSLFYGGRFLKAARFFWQVGKLPGVSARQMLLFAGGSLLPEWLKRPARWFVSEELFPRWMKREWFLKRGVTPQAPCEPQAARSLRTLLLESFRETSLPRLLRYEDRNSMAFSIESRVPFLTPQLVEFVFSLPDSYLISDNATSKHVFRAAMRGIVPDAILDRRDKIGFVAPDKAWLAAPSLWVERIFKSETLRAIPALVPDTIQEQCQRVFAGQRPFDWCVWRWLNLIRWSELLEIQY